MSEEQDKFDGQERWVKYFHGFSNTCEVEVKETTYLITQSEKEKYPELRAATRVKIRETKDGFVYGEIVDDVEVNFDKAMRK